MSKIRTRLQAIADATGRSIYDVAQDALRELMNERNQPAEQPTVQRSDRAMNELFEILDEENDDDESH